MAVIKLGVTLRNKAFAALEAAFQVEKTSEIHYNTLCMAWLLNGGLVLM